MSISKNGIQNAGIFDQKTNLSANVKENPNTLNNELLINSEGHQCVENSSVTPLLSNGVFLGSGWQDTIDYGVLSINVATDQNSATNGLVIQWSHDGLTIVDTDKFTILANIPKTFTFGPAERYYRVSYTNGTVAQGTFNITSILRRCYVKPSSHRIQDSIVADDDAELMKSVITGVKPNGVFSNANLTSRANLKVSLDEYGDTPAIDSFDRLRTSQPFTLFDSKQLHDKKPLFWDETIGGSATSTHIPVDASTAMTVTANAADFVIRQTKQRPNYQPGKSQLVFMTFRSAQVAGVIKRVGLFDGTGTNNLTPNNGIFFETDGSISWNIAKNGTTTETVTQANWSLDKLDGTGPSGLTLNLNAAHILIIDFEWLGIGRVRVGFVINGLIVYVHNFNHANDPAFTSVYMSSPNLPLRYSIQSTGAGAGTLNHICSTIMSEGGVEELGVLRSIDNGILPVTASTAGLRYALLGIRLKSTYNDITVTPVGVSLLSITKGDIRWSLILNPTVAGTFTYTDLTNSAVQTAVGVSTNTVTGGTIIGSGYLSASSSSEQDLKTALRLGVSIAGVTDTLVLCFTGFANSATAVGSLNWRELL